MLKNKPLLFAMLALMLALAFTVYAQDVEPSPDVEINPNANMSWPPPVYVVRGEFTIRGSANLANMTNYFVEFRALNDDLTPQDDNQPWSPAILPTANAVQDDVLGVWDTTVVPDGVYELRLTINLQGSDPFFFRVAPVRVENVPPPFALTPTAIPASPTPVATLPPPPPPPTATPSTPIATANVNANVRSGDSTQYPIVGSLEEGESAPIVGVSSFGTGWYVIDLSGRRGWISPSVVNVSGDTSSLPRIGPPPVPTPVATATPVTVANIVIDAVNITPFPLNCSETASINVTIRNAGTGATNSGGTIFVQDVHISSGQQQQSTTGTFPALNPGQTFVSQMRLTVSTFHREQHRININVDSGNQVAEINEGDNGWSSEYQLQQATCP
jgi:uncharacterized protein YgiM (DUF1202 family)